MKRLSEEIYIETAYKMMESEGIENVSIRKIANVLGFSSAAMYKYFESLDNLILYASIRYLVPYMQDLNSKLSAKHDALTNHFVVWESFAYHSFQNAKIFNNMFFGYYSKSLRNVIKHYYSMFGAEISDLNNTVMSFVNEGDFVLRDRIMVDQCVAEGFFRADRAPLINMLDVYIYKGALKEVLDNPDVDKTVVQARFMQCLRSAILPYSTVP